jgi:hypothetical protein
MEVLQKRFCRRNESIASLLTLLLQDRATFRSDVALVRVDAEVRTESGPVMDSFTMRVARVALRLPRSTR